MRLIVFCLCCALCTSTHPRHGMAKIQRSRDGVRAVDGVCGPQRPGNDPASRLVIMELLRE